MRDSNTSVLTPFGPATAGISPAYLVVRTERDINYVSFKRNSRHESEARSTFNTFKQWPDLLDSVLKCLSIVLMYRLQRSLPIAI